MKLYHFSALNPEAAIYASAVYNIHVNKLLKDWYRIFMFDELCRHHCLEMLRDEDESGWAADPLRESYAFWADVKVFFHS